MTDMSVGAVGAAFIAGLVSLLSLVIGKEQKISEFRQIWIDELRKCIVSYIVNINAISDIMRLKKAGEAIDNSSLLSMFKALNEANHGISLRINENEKPSKRLLDCMADFEKLSKSNADLTPENIGCVEKKFASASKDLLKHEWCRVKRGEKTFVLTKWIVCILLVAMSVLMIYLLYSSPDGMQHGKNLYLVESRCEFR